MDSCEIPYACCRLAAPGASLSVVATLRYWSATRGDSVTTEANLARLEGLARELADRGLRVRLMTPPGRIPSLHVVNPAAVSLAEDVYAGRAQDGQWWFWWSWAEQIALGEDLEGAAAMISRVLAVARSPVPAHAAG
jgi:hypothetical protein